MMVPVGKITSILPVGVAVLAVEVGGGEAGGGLRRIKPEDFSLATTSLVALPVAVSALSALTLEDCD